MEFFVICVSVGIETTPKAQPIPSVVAGNAGDWLTLSPFAIQFWVSGICVLKCIPSSDNDSSLDSEDNYHSGS